VVLEMVPQEIARRVTAELRIPTIGIGAGNGTDGQILVWTDFAGLTSGRVPRFVRRYADMRAVLLDAAMRYRDDVVSGAFPDASESYAD
jgi:3-methyl-2-oxobutanoate hydroxymethyltransferase